MKALSTILCDLNLELTHLQELKRDLLVALVVLDEQNARALDRCEDITLEGLNALSPLLDDPRLTAHYAHDHV
jgi:hypothetical protein